MNNGKANFGNIEDFIKEKGKEMIDLIKETSLSWEEAKKVVYPRLVNYEWNKETLEDTIITRKFGDLAVLFYLKIDEETTVMVRRKMIEEIWKKEIDEVMETAIENMRKDNKKPVRKFLGMTVVTNTEEKFGASALLDWRTRASLEEEVGEAWLIPSSIHEWIILPTKDFDTNKEELNKMVKEANQEVVDVSEWLSDHVYKLTETGDIISCA